MSDFRKKNQATYKAILDQINWRKFMQSILAIALFYAVVKTFNYNLKKLIDGEEVYWAHALIHSIGITLVWILLIPIIFVESVKIFFHSAKWIIRVRNHLLIVIFIAPLHAFLFLTLNYWLQTYLDLWLPERKKTYYEYLQRAFPNQSADSALFYGIVVGLLTAYILYLKNISDAKRQTVIEKNLTKTRLTNLRYQLQPHFLFNSLQTISNLFHIDKKKGDKAISNLSEVLRFSINHLEVDLVGLDEEIEITKKYLDFQKLRYSQTISYDFQIKGEISNIKVPCLILQPIVENSIKHGFEATGEKTALVIEIDCNTEHVNFLIKDNGPGFEKKDTYHKKSGGLENLKDRLKYFYMENCEFEILDVVHGSEIKMILPKKVENASV